MIELTPEQQQAIDEANGSPLVVIDRRTEATYRLVRTKISDKLHQVQSCTLVCPELSEGTRRALAALRRDLPELLANPRNRGRHVCYHLEERLGISKDYLSLVRKCYKRGLPEEEWIVMAIEPGAGEEEIEL